MGSIDDVSEPARRDTKEKQDKVEKLMADHDTASF
jgi:hypothetical protein